MRFRANLFSILLVGTKLFFGSCGGAGNSGTTPPPVTAPTITSQPASQAVTAGQSATFSVTASGTLPFTYQWFMNGAAVGTNSSTFTISQTTLTQNRAQINVKISNTAGSATSNTVTLTVNAAPVAPSITQQPISHTVTVGQPVTFSVTAAGTSPLTYQWFLNGTAAGTNSSTFTISQTTSAQDQAQIRVTVSNTAGSAMSNTVILTVSPLPSSVLTYHNDNMRTGQNVNETILTPANVNAATFGKLFALTVDGQVFAQPLYMPAVTVGSQIHDLVFVATEHDSVYAWDADTFSANPIWQTSFINPAAGVTAVPCGEAASGQGNCTSITPEFGISGTPVIDSSTGTLYVVAYTKEVVGSTISYVYRLHALSITTGAEKFGGPVAIQATSGTVSLVHIQHMQRPGLLLLNGVVYIGFGSHGDIGTWYGWLLGYSASTLQQVMVFNAAPNGKEAAIWQSGCAPAADSNGNIYVITGNGTFTANSGGVDYGDTILKLNANGTVADYFTPTDQLTLDTSDDDLGSGGHIVLPNLTGTFPHLLIGAGKQGVIYVINRDNMGKFNASGDRSVQSLAALTSGPSSGGLFGSPAFWNNLVYFVAWNDFLKAFQLNSNGTLSLSSTGPITLAFPGATPSVSANGTSNGIVWIIQANVANDSVLNTVPAAVLRAYDATNVAVELYDSSQAANNRDIAGGAVKFAVPTVANGKVYVGNRNQLTVYGLLP